MKRTPKVYSSTIDATKAAAYYDRLHVLKDAIEALQRQYNDDMAEVYAEASEDLNADPALLRMAFTAERQKRKREAKIARMDAGKAQQLDLLSDIAAGSEALSSEGHSKSLSPKLVENIAKAVQTPAGKTALGIAVDVMIEREARGISVADIPASLDRRVKPSPHPSA